LVRLTRDDRLGNAAKPFSRFVHQLFAARRKTLRKALSQIIDDPATLLASLGIDGQLRPEVLAPEHFLRLHRSITARPIEGRS
jgi:16S rRNA A1518/A1519 N6-dimethyltransferase RsmA/KsgA/DIM1 with predicted DNA glycosylase/AP lyase activity